MVGRRTWIKIYSEKWLRGTLREETSSVRGIWADLLALAGDSAYGDFGIIKLSEHTGLSDDQVCDILSISAKEWEVAKNRLVETARIKITGKNIIHICKWQEYQSEYERQKKYRKKHLWADAEGK